MKWNQTFLLVAFAGMASLATLMGAQILPQTKPAELVVRSSPGAKVTVDGVFRGNIAAGGSLAIRDLGQGEHILHVEQSGKTPVTRKLTIVPGKVTRVRVELTSYTGDLEVLTAPNAEVLLNGKAAGQADGSGRLIVRGLGVRTYKVQVGGAAYNSEEGVAHVARDVLTSVTLKLTPIEAPSESTGVPAPRYALQRRLVAYPEGVQGAFFRPNSVELVSWGKRDGVLVWDTATGRQIKELAFIDEGGKSLYFYSVSPDLRWLAVKTLGGAHSNRLVDVEIGTVVRSLSRNGYPRIFTADSKRLVVGAERSFVYSPSDGSAEFYEVETGKRLRAWQDPSIGGSVSSWAVSPDGHWIATGAEGITLWDAETGKESRRFSAKERITTVAFSPNGQWLAALSLNSIELWEAATGRQARTIERPKSESGELLNFTHVVFTQDSGYLISLNESQAAHVAYVWNALAGSEIHKWTVGPSQQIVLSPDGEFLVLVGKHLTVWRRTN